MGSVGVETQEVDILIVGAGFGAVTLLQKLLENGYDARVFEKGQSFGGIW